MTAARVKAVVAARIDRIPALRWRVQAVPLGLDHATFVDGEVDLDAHVLERDVDAPGGPAEFARAAGEIMSVKLDRRRPLWEFHVLHGLADGRTGLAMKFHHAQADALSAATLMTLLVDVDPHAPRTDLPEPVPTQPPPGRRSRTRTTAAGVARQPVQTLRAGLRTLPHLDQVPMLRTLPGARAATRATRLVQRLAGDDSELPAFANAPRMRFNGRLSPRRSIAFGGVDVEVVRRIKTAHGVTFNDVVVAAVAGGLRTHLADRDELPDDPLVAFIPTNVRTDSHSGQIENAISSFVVPIPTDLRRSGDRIDAASEAMRAAKARSEAAPPTLMADANAMVLPIVFAPLAAGILKLVGSGRVDPPINLTLSNVPGPPVRLHLDGAPLERAAPLSLIFDGATVNLTVVSYAGTLELGLVGDAEAIDDGWEIIAAVEAEFARLDPGA